MEIHNEFEESNGCIIIKIASVNMYEHDNLPWDDRIANEALHHQPIHLMKIHWKRQELPYHCTNHCAYAHVLDATNQKDGYVDLF